VKPHELNTAFTWEDRSGPYRIISAEQARQYDEQGFFVFEDAFPLDVIEALVTEIDPIEAQFESIIRDKLGGKAFIARADEITFTTHIVMQSPTARAFTRSGFFRDLTYDLLGRDVRLYWDQAVYKKPGTLDPFPWHQDNGYTYVEPQRYLTCWVALTDADEENGCPWVIPGVHRQGTLEHQLSDLGFVCVEEEPASVISAPVRAGGVVVFSSLTPHYTGPNTSTDRIRKSYIVQFAPDGARVIQKQGEGYSETPCNAPERQYPILVNGEPPAG
jgi:ectoine hydroxylase-related dioxygenase (phytanoyl-CoA dioxygenase family)